jgi:ribose transport system substrate-binding protein
MIITRRGLVTAAAAGSAGLLLPRFAVAAPAGLPTLAKKATYKVGFAQTESNNPWRVAETNSMQDEAKKLGYQLIYTDAASSAAKQVSDVNSMIAQGVDVIFLAPREEKPLVPAIFAAKKAGVTMILLDRNVDQSLAKAGRDYLTFIGSDFVEEGHRIAEWLIKATNGKAQIIELEGTTGASAATDRKKGFDEIIAKQPGMKVVASQNGDFTRDKGRQVAETLLQAHPDVNAVYAHNDEMALGAIAAIKAAGKTPGKDVIVCSIDGERDAVKLVSDGELGATCECNPRFGPKAFSTMQAYANGDKIPPMVINADQFYDKDNAAKLLDTAF